MDKERGRIVNRGMGGFLNPPGHPEHDFSVEFDLRRNPDNRGGCSLSSAIDSEWLHDSVRNVAKALLDAWQEVKLPIDNPSVREWIFNIMGYFKNCYRNPDMKGEEQWYVTNILIIPERNAVQYQDEHCGVRLIRSYYPDFNLTDYHIANAYWGSKKP
jgi:hypothetical protein